MHATVNLLPLILRAGLRSADGCAALPDQRATRGRAHGQTMGPAHKPHQQGSRGNSGKHEINQMMREKRARLRSACR